ncbi:dTDP-4-amino-4,6-dideoxygalactose transaminase [Halogranum amylolyticum]|uniref:dTDP-4-amino-4,6-dideoxygalactose transaminase n=1 Tax=Halogranum amylolyticum TaxID=660520 RepID=A0A1H8UJW2_9EURY|nr:aminotransferase class I/II-fold pyridoxal phosphate-dependent enzyme [Halogranum amylolyticum]SEP02888.1 dTDP-4-amino-4,6-dideoxygalactose transaminase [Halogranum amylolyticum]
MAEQLAIHGGQQTVTHDEPERWERPVQKEKDLVNDLIDRLEISAAGSGLPKEFEDAFADYTGAKHCVTLNHGSTALEAAYYAVGVGPGDEVITPTAGYIGAYAGALHMGARPVFCEVDPDTLLADPADIESRITDRTAAINVTHWNGRVCDMDALLEIRDRYEIPIVEDAAHAHGSYWDGEHIGTVGDICCFSLQGVNPYGKPLAGGEGGILTTNNDEYYQRQLSYCHLHRSGMREELTHEPYTHLDYEVLGKKYRSHPLAIAFAKVGLETLEYRCNRRIAYRKQLFERLADIDAVRTVKTYEKSDSGGFYGGLRVVFQPDEMPGVDAETYVSALQAEGVDAGGPGFHYMEHLRYQFKQGYDLWGNDRGPLGGEFCGLPTYEGYSKGDFPVSEELDQRVIILPSYIEPKPGHLDEVVAAFEKLEANAEQLAAHSPTKTL